MCRTGVCAEVTSGDTEVNGPAAPGNVASFDINTAAPRARQNSSSAGCPARSKQPLEPEAPCAPHRALQVVAAVAAELRQRPERGIGAQRPRYLVCECYKTRPPASPWSRPLPSVHQPQAQSRSSPAVDQCRLRSRTADPHQLAEGSSWVIKWFSTR